MKGAMVMALALIIGLVSMGLARAVPPQPEFHQVYGVVVPADAAGSLVIRTGSSSVGVVIRDGQFGLAPNLVKVNGTEGEVMEFLYAGVRVANLSFKPRAISFLTIWLPAQVIIRQNIMGRLPTGLTLLVDGDVLQDRNLTGVHTISIAREGEDPMLEARIDFTSFALNLSLVSFEEEAIGKGGGSIHGLSLPSGATKSLRIARVANGNAVCIRDQDGASVENMTQDCSGPAEVQVFCDQIFNFGYRCSNEGSAFLIEGLRHSAVVEIPSVVPGAAEEGAVNGVQGNASGGGGLQNRTQVLMRNITIQKYRLNLTSEPQVVVLDLRDTVEFLQADQKILVIHTGTGDGNATFKSLPSGVVFRVFDQKATVVDVTQDGTLDIEIRLLNISFHNVTVAFSLPTKMAPGQVKPLEMEVPVQNQTISGVHQAEDTKRVAVPQSTVEAPSEPGTKSAVVPALQPAVELPAQEARLMDRARGFAAPHPFLTPLVSLALAAVIVVVAYAGFLLVMEVHAIREITQEILRNLGLGVPLGQIQEALRQGGHSPAHIRKAMVAVASRYVRVSLQQGSNPTAIHIELEGRGWPVDVIGQALPK